MPPPASRGRRRRRARTRVRGTERGPAARRRRDPAASGSAADQGGEVAARCGLRDQGVETRLCRSSGTSTMPRRSLTMSPPVRSRFARARSASRREPRREVRGARRRAESEAQQLLQRRPLGVPRAVRPLVHGEPRGEVQLSREAGRAQRGGAEEDGIHRILLLRHGAGSAAHRRPRPRRPRCAPCSRRRSRTCRSRRATAASASPSSVTGQRSVCHGRVGRLQTELCARTAPAGLRLRRRRRARRTTRAFRRRRRAGRAAALRRRRAGGERGRSRAARSPPSAPRVVGTPCWVSVRAGAGSSR